MPLRHGTLDEKNPARMPDSKTELHLAGCALCTRCLVLYPDFDLDIGLDDLFKLGLIDRPIGTESVMLKEIDEPLGFQVLLNGVENFPLVVEVQVESSGSVNVWPIFALPVG